MRNDAYHIRPEMRSDTSQKKPAASVTTNNTALRAASSTNSAVGNANATSRQPVNSAAVMEVAGSGVQKEKANRGISSISRREAMERAISKKSKGCLLTHSTPILPQRLG